MSIVSSVYELEPHDQADGRVWVTERHTDGDGIVYEHRYKGARNVTDFQAVMASRAAEINTMLADQEAERILYG